MIIHNVTCTAAESKLKGLLKGERNKRLSKTKVVIRAVSNQRRVTQTPLNADAGFRKLHGNVR